MRIFLPRSRRRPILYREQNLISISSMKLISLIIPVFNEDRSLSQFYFELDRSLSKNKNYQYEIIFIDDGSRDRSLEMVKNFSINDKRIKYLSFTRNFGKEMAITAGLHNSRGEAIITMDSDLQHPPELISELLRHWESGAEVVIGVRRNLFKGYAHAVISWIYYNFFSRISDTDMVFRETDFRLIDQKVAREFCRLSEADRLTRVAINWLGFKKKYVSFESSPRVAGSSNYSLPKLFRVGVMALVSYSLFPLKFAGYLGVLITVLAALLGLFILTEKYILDDPWNLNFSGPALLAVINLFLTGVILSCLGLISLYIANIQTEVRRRPLWVIREKSL